MACFFCLQIVANVFTTMLLADQKSALSSFIQTIGQFLAYIAIWILTKKQMVVLPYWLLHFPEFHVFH